MYFFCPVQFDFHDTSNSMGGIAFILGLLQSWICGHSLQNKYQT